MLEFPEKWWLKKSLFKNFFRIFFLCKYSDLILGSPISGNFFWPIKISRLIFLEFQKFDFWRKFWFWFCYQNFDLKLVFWSKLFSTRILTDILIFDQNLELRRKFRFFYQNCEFRSEFQFSTKISILDHNFDFLPKLRISIGISIFDQNLDFRPKFRFWPKFRFLT